MDKNKSLSENLREVLKHVVCRDTSDAVEQKKVGYLDALVRFLQQKENQDFKDEEQNLRQIRDANEFKCENIIVIFPFIGAPPPLFSLHLRHVFCSEAEDVVRNRVKYNLRQQIWQSVMSHN